MRTQHLEIKLLKITVLKKDLKVCFAFDVVIAFAVVAVFVVGRTFAFAVA